MAEWNTASEIQLHLAKEMVREDIFKVRAKNVAIHMKHAVHLVHHCALPCPYSSLISLPEHWHSHIQEGSIYCVHFERLLLDSKLPH